MRELADAKAAVEAGDLPRALACLLAAWRAKPAAAIAEAIERVGARAAAGLQPPTGKTAAERNATWDRLARAGDPVARHALVASLTDTKGCMDTLARIELLVAHSPDPRVSAKIADLIETPAYNATVSRTSAFWKRAFALLPELGDPRIAMRATTWPQKWRANKELNEPEPAALHKRLDAILPALAAQRQPALDAADAAACAAIVAALGAPARDPGANSEADLLAAICAAPDDDAPRAVYADWLQQRDDPRGEFIALQLAPRTRDGARREKELLAEFAARWLAAYGDVKKTTARFERGFVAACDAPAWGDTPLWATVRECSVPPTRADQRGDSLRVVGAAQDNHVVALATLTRPLAIEELRWRGLYWNAGAWSSDDGALIQNAAAAIAAFPTIRVLPRLRRLELSGSESWFGRHDFAAVGPDDLAWAWGSPWTPALAELAFPGELAAARRWLDAVAVSRLVRVELRSRAEAGFDDAWRATFERATGAKAWRLELAGPKAPKQEWLGEHYGDWVVAALAMLHDTPLLAISVAIPAAAWSITAALRGALATALPEATIARL